jgi:hypothetical protein
MPRFFSHPSRKKRSTRRSRRSHKRSHTKKQRGGRGGGGGGLGGASYHGAFTTGATQVLNQLSPAPY